MKKLLCSILFTLLSVISTYATVYSDGTNVDDWRVYTSIGGKISTHNGIIKLAGSGLSTGYRLKINDAQSNNLKWRMRYDEPFVLYILVNTEEGNRYLIYTPIDKDRGVNGTSIRFGLGANTANGEWHSFSRNLDDDLHKFEPNNKILGINRLLVRGSGEIDDIETFVEDSSDQFSVLLDEALQARKDASPEYSIYEKIERLNNSNFAVVGRHVSDCGDECQEENFDIYTFNQDTQELIKLINFRLDTSNPRIYELFYDKITFSDDGKILTINYKNNVWNFTYSYDISDVNNVKYLGHTDDELVSSIVFKDYKNVLNPNYIYTHNSLTKYRNSFSQWDGNRYVNKPYWKIISGAEGASIDLEWSPPRYFAKLRGSGLSTAYRLKLKGAKENADSITWKMRYSEPFTVYIQVETLKGYRYLIYTARNDDRGLSADGRSIRFGVGADVINGEWQRFVRDIDADIKKYEPDNGLISFNRMIIRGSGDIMDVQTFKWEN